MRSKNFVLVKYMRVPELGKILEEVRTCPALKGAARRQFQKPDIFPTTIIH